MRPSGTLATLARSNAFGSLLVIVYEEEVLYNSESSPIDTACRKYHPISQGFRRLSTDHRERTQGGMFCVST